MSGRLTGCAALTALGTAGWAAAPLLGHPQLGTPVLAAGVGLGAARLVVGRGRAERQFLHESLVESLAPLTGVSAPDGVALRLWSKGLPQEVKVSYSGARADQDEKWRRLLVETVSARLGQDYKLSKLDSVKTTALLVPAEGTAKAAAKSPGQRRAEKALLQLLGETGTITGVTVDEHGVITALEAHHQDPTRMAMPGSRRRIERTVGTMMPGRWRAHWDLENDRVRFEVRPSLPSSIWAPPLDPGDTEDLLANYGRVRIPYGVDEDGNEIAWAPARVPQMLITGQTGTGKTATTQGIIGGITQFGWPVWIADAKRVEFLAFRDWPNVQVVATTVEQIVALVHRAWVLMEERYRLYECGLAQLSDFEPLVIVLDEWTDFVQALLEWYPTVKGKGGPAKPPTLREEASLARKARTARIHIIKTMQRPDVALLGGLGGEVRSNYGQRISVGRSDPQGAQMMWENASIGVTIPRGMRGRSITTNDEGQPVEIQAYRFPDPDAHEGSEEHELLTALRPTESRHPRVLILPPEQQSDLDDDSVVPLTFWEYAETRWDLAERHPDLDPIRIGQRADPSQGRQAASTMASLGIVVDDTPAAAAPVGRPALRLVGSDDSFPDPDVNEDELSDFAGYEDPVDVDVFDLAVGDLIEVEPGTWAVVDEEPMEDPEDDTQVVVSWQSDTDDSIGEVLVVPAGSTLRTRRPGSGE